MVAALAGDSVGRLHPATPHPPLVASVEADLERHAIPPRAQLDLDLTIPSDLARSHVLHRLRILAIPGYDRRSGPTVGSRPELGELWAIERSELWLPALIEAGSFGATLESAAVAALGDCFTRAGSDAAEIAHVLFDATLCGLDDLSEQVMARAAAVVGGVVDMTGLGVLLANALGLWRHDRLFGTAGSPALAGLVDSAATRALWPVEGIRGGPAPADDGRLRAVVAVRDAVVHAEPVLGVSKDAVAAVFHRSAARDRPPDLRGASVGMAWVLEEDPADPTATEDAVRGAAHAETLGDFLAGLFAVAREEVLTNADPGVLGILDDVLTRMDEDDFLVAIPSLRLAFSWFPPREREAIAERLLERRGVEGSARSLLRLQVDAATLAHARAVEARADDLLTREALLSQPGPPAAGDGEPDG